MSKLIKTFTMDGLTTAHLGQVMQKGLTTSHLQQAMAKPAASTGQTGTGGGGAGDSSPPKK